jgi:hypothetical protein
LVIFSGFAGGAAGGFTRYVRRLPAALARSPIVAPFRLPFAIVSAGR